MDWKIQAPAKTFLAGEYVVLQGGPALLLTTIPCFELHIKEKMQVQEGTPALSPAEKLKQKYSDFFSRYEFKFIDPYHGLGGLGASSAEFAMLAAFKHYIEQKKLDYSELIDEYRQLSYSGEGVPASGADVIAQINGRITHVNTNQVLTITHWPFSEISYVLLHTRNKIATHSHLANLSQSAFELGNLEKIIGQLVRAVESREADVFCDAINRTAAELQNLNLVAPHTQQLLQTIRERTEVLAAKGCGALSADIILVLLPNAHLSTFLEWAKPQFNVMASGQHIASGLEISEASKNNEHVILVDREDNPIGEAEKLTAHQQALLHRAFSIFIFRQGQNGIETLLQQRALKKYHGGGLWSNTCCSHPHPGETVKESAALRLQQEMGLHVPLMEVGAFTYYADMHNHLYEHEYDHVLIGRFDAGEIVPNKEEVENYLWIELNSLQQQLIEQPTRFSPWLKQALELIIQNNHLAKLFA